MVELEGCQKRDLTRPSIWAAKASVTAVEIAFEVEGTLEQTHGVQLFALHCSRNGTVMVTESLPFSSRFLSKLTVPSRGYLTVKLRRKTVSPYQS